MFKLFALFATLPLLYSSWLSGLSLPRFSQSPADYVLMPLIGFIMIIVAAQIAARLGKE